MKKQTAIFIALILVALIGTLLIRYHSTLVRQESISTVTDENTNRVTRSHDRSKTEQAEPMSAFLRAFKSPITLYGKVVDQHGAPVAGATVTLSPLRKPFGDGSSDNPTRVTDSDGKFSIKGLQGYSMGVSAQKDDGYLSIAPLGGPTSLAIVGYGEDSVDGKRYSNPSTPLILTLQKIGPTEPMVFVDFSRRYLPVDGNPNTIALDSEKGVGPHKIVFRFKSDWNKLPKDNEINLKRYDWSFEAQIPGGGFVWSDRDYDFEAPQEGYRESVRLEYNSDMPSDKWKGYGSGSFFVKFADGCHGLIRFSIDGSSDDGPLTLKTWLNPKPESRNLATNQMTESSAIQERYRIEWK